MYNIHKMELSRRPTLTWADLPSLMSCATARRAALGPPRRDLSGDTCSSLIRPSVSCFTLWSILDLQEYINQLKIRDFIGILLTYKNLQIFWQVRDSIIISSFFKFVICIPEFFNRWSSRAIYKILIYCKKKKDWEWNCITCKTIKHVNYHKSKTDENHSQI